MKSPLRAAYCTVLVWCSAGVCAQPSLRGDSVRFVLADSTARSVAVVGDFNGWSKAEDRLSQAGPGKWEIVRPIWPGLFQYKFVLDGDRYVLDPGNPATIENYNRSALNSAFVVTSDQALLLTSTPPRIVQSRVETNSPVPERKPVFLNIIWHQHQPLYVNPETDQLTGPWVRTHATKDYYDMAAMLRPYQEVHCTFNLTSSLLVQLRDYYVARLQPFVEVMSNRIDAEGFLARWGGKTDPWIDLALRPTASFTTSDRDYLYRNAWNCLSISEVMISRFPEYQALKTKLVGGSRQADDLFSEQELRELKFWFYLSMFDPDFLDRSVTLDDGLVCDLTGYVRKGADGKYRLKKWITEADCQRMVVEAYKVMANVIPMHRRLKYNPQTGTGQIDIITTPFYHPILPLIYDSDLARTCQPDDPLPARFNFPDDARAQVSKAVKFYREVFGYSPTGMWPGEGSVAQQILPILKENGIVWTASDVKVLNRSTPAGRPNTTPYAFPAGDGSVAVVFRDTELSDRIGFKYQEYAGEEAAEDFVQAILKRAPRLNEPDVLITVILDGENAWEWYRKDQDGKEFLNALYRKLTVLRWENRIITTTLSEYIAGNPLRGVPPHPVSRLPAMEELWPGSWINGNYDTWIGEQEENQAWEYLLRVRHDLASSGIPQPDPASDPPPQGTREWSAYRAWESMYAAEGSDWFWWYGTDQGAPGGDRPFDVAFRTHLRNVYRFANDAGARLEAPELSPILHIDTGTGSTARTSGAAGGTMARASDTSRTVQFECDARSEKVTAAIYIAGSDPALGSWVPNTIALRDDGLAGDAVARDGIWTVRIDLPAGTSVEYKFTNSGTAGAWEPGDEFHARNRSLEVQRGSEILVVRDIFGK